VPKNVGVAQKENRNKIEYKCKNNNNKPDMILI
jgi:hypothetical protein